MTTDIVVTFDLDPALVERIAAVDPGVRVRTVGRGALASFGGRLPDPSELQRAIPSDEIQAALPEAEVLLSAWFGRLRYLNLSEVAPRLRWVQLTHAGAETVDEALTGDVTFTTAGGMAAAPIAEWVLGAMLMFAKG